jgi:uncharacterized protein
VSAPQPRRSRSADIEAFDRVCEQLSGFDETLSAEWIDGFLCALAAGPRVPAAAEWIEAMCGDSYERAFADPDDRARALRALQTRLSVLCDQLDPQALIDDPDQIRIEPLMLEWTDADRRTLVERDRTMSAEEAAQLQTGAEWADGFLAGVEALPEVWSIPEDDAAQRAFGPPLEHVAALVLPPDSDELVAHLAEHYPTRTPTREELITEALASIQDLRWIWVDRAPKPPTRRVESQPGRNDPCPCGSGKKFKRCHGAVAR